MQKYLLSPTCWQMSQAEKCCHAWHSNLLPIIGVRSGGEDEQQGVKLLHWLWRGKMNNFRFIFSIWGRSSLDVCSEWARKLFELCMLWVSSSFSSLILVSPMTYFISLSEVSHSHLSIPLILLIVPVLPALPLRLHCYQNPVWVSDLYDAV